MLLALRAYTGYHITLVAGRKVDDQFDLVSVHAGTTKTKQGTDVGKDFTQWNETGYADHVLNQFVRFLVAAGETCFVDAPNRVADVSDCRRGSQRRSGGSVRARGI